MAGAPDAASTWQRRAAGLIRTVSRENLMPHPKGFSPQSLRFPRDRYEVRRTSGRWAGLWAADTEYEIRATGYDHERFSHSIATGHLRDAVGELVLMVTQDRRRMTVIAASGHAVGALVARSNGWSIHDASGRAAGGVDRESLAAHRAIYTARVADLECCQFVWSSEGWRRHVLTLTFGPGRDLDPALAVAVAPYVEADAYRRTEWRRYWRYT